MIKQVSSAAGIGSRLWRVLVVLCLCLGLAACAESTSTKTSDKAQGQGGPAGTVKRIAYGISINVPDNWIVVNAVEPGAISNTELESRVKGGTPTPLLLLVRPTAVANQADARVIIRIADAKKHLLPEEAATALTQAQFDEQAKALVKNSNEAAQKAKNPTRLLDWGITRDTVDNKLAIVQRGLVQEQEGQSRVLVWYIYLPNGMGVAVEAAGKADVVGIDGILESIVKSISVTM